MTTELPVPKLKRSQHLDSKMKLPDFSHLPKDLQRRLAKESPTVQRNLARLSAVQIRKILDNSVFGMAVAATAQLTPEEKAMGEEAFIDLCIERSQAMKREREKAREEDRRLREAG